ncbi:hypothetical protein LJR118_003261 [Acidovorax sp. LjRoot118]|uniref:hypothetical protein n=1 Tax=unclassified Acidovorax TaxID=2684926 RepID=UPI000AAB67ED|nr:hypothetical protein [Acidovorax sp. Root217]
MTAMVDIVLGMVLLTMPPTPQPVTYTATSGATTLGYSSVAGWVPAEQCFNRCHTIANEPVPLLRGELSLADMADLGIVIRRDGVPVLSFWRFFGNVPVAYVEGGR